MSEYEYDEIQDMIDTAIRKAMREHERNVAIISGVAGILGLVFYTHGVIALVKNLGKHVAGT